MVKPSTGTHVHTQVIQHTLTGGRLPGPAQARKLLSVIEVAPFHSMCNAVYSLGLRSKMWPWRQKPILQRPGQPEDTMRWTVSKLCSDPLTGSVAPNLPPSFNACNWDSSLEVCLQAAGAASSVCLLELGVLWEWNLGNDWRGRGMCEGNRKAQSIHLKSSRPDYFGK